MKTQSIGTGMKSLFALLTIVLALGASQAASASAITTLQSARPRNNLPPVQIMTEALISSEGGDAALLERIFGPDPSSPLNFTSFVDPASFTFSFLLNQGSTYLGQQITESAHGSFDPNTGVLTATTTGTVGVNSFSITEVETLRNTVSGMDGSGDQIFSMNGVETERRRVTHIRWDKDGHSLESGHFVDEHGHRIPGSDFEDEPDQRSPEESDWDWGTRHGREGVRSLGSSPITGGAGTFTTTISAPAPEPSSLLFLGSGILGIAGVLRKRLLN